MRCFELSCYCVPAGAAPLEVEPSDRASDSALWVRILLERRMRRGVYSGREDAGRYGKEDEPGMPYWSEERARAQHAGQTPPAVQGVTDTMDPTRVCVF